jgi:hypothetical protein
MQNKVAMVDNELELEEILMFLDGELWKWKYCMP